MHSCALSDFAPPYLLLFIIYLFISKYLREFTRLFPEVALVLHTASIHNTIYYSITELK